MTLAIVDGDVLLYMSIWNSETQEDARKKFDSIFKENLEAIFATDYAMALGGPNNFREVLYVDYKRSLAREKSRSNKPEWFDDLKSSIAKDYSGVELSYGCESDDLVRIWATECDKHNKPRVVVSIDKDLDCIAGIHLNPRSGLIYEIEEDWADNHYWKQILMGDATDNIPGIAGIGKVKADAILSFAKDHEERKAVVCQAYYKKYEEEGYSYLVTNGRLIHIWRFINDHFKMKKEFYDNAIHGRVGPLELPITL